jgi:predicted CoA-binding protein
MNHDRYEDGYIRGILNTVRTITLVGASANTVRPSYFVLKYLLEKGYRMIPINPGLAGKELLGCRVYANLREVPEPIDMIDIFRNSEVAGRIVDEALSLDHRPQVVWMQLGIRNDEAARRAEEAGVKVVMNRCPKIEYGRLSGEIGWAGVNTRILSSKRPRLQGTGFQRLAVSPQRDGKQS